MEVDIFLQLIYLSPSIYWRYPVGEALCWFMGEETYICYISFSQVIYHLVGDQQIILNVV